MPDSNLTPDSRRLLARAALVRRPPMHKVSPQEARTQQELGSKVLDYSPAPMAQVLSLRIPTTETYACPARLYVPTEHSGEPMPVVLHLHGGGCVVGSLDTHDATCRQIAARSGAAVLALAYRLAPEHPFPAAVDDCFAALEWLWAGGARALGLDPRRMAVAGDSAGATLAAVTAIHARDAGIPLALQLLITPRTAAGFDTPSHSKYGIGFLVEHPQLSWCHDLYIPRDRRSDWRFAPMLADDLSGVAPAYMVLAECDPFHDEGLAYADRLRAEGCEVDIDLVRGVTHNFMKLPRAIAAAEPAMQAACDALRRAWHKLERRAVRRQPSGRAYSPASAFGMA